MNALKAYRYYQSIKLHFTQEKFDVFKNKGAINISPERFIQRNDRFIFDNLGKKYDDKTFIQYIACNFMYNHDAVLYDSDTANQHYQTFLKRKESITYVVQSDLSYLMDHDVVDPVETFRHFLGDRITLETLSILNDFSNIINDIKRSPVGLLFGPNLLRVQKSKGFVRYNTERIRPVYNSYLEEIKSNHYGTHLS